MIEISNINTFVYPNGRHQGMFSKFIRGILSVDTESDKPASFRPFAGLRLSFPDCLALGFVAECIKYQISMACQDIKSRQTELQSRIQNFLYQLFEGLGYFLTSHPEKPLDFAQGKLREQGSRRILQLFGLQDEPSRIDKKKNSLRIHLFKRNRNFAKAAKFWVILFFTFCIFNSNSYAFEEIGEELKLYLGEVKVLSVNNPKRIVIGNPDVVDVSEATKNEITLIPKGAGTTNFIFWDDFGEQSIKIKVFSEDIKEIKRRVDNLLEKLNLSEVYTRAEEEEGKIFLLGRVKTSQDRERIVIALSLLKQKVVDLIEVKEEEAVVEINVDVLELTKDASKTLGFTWPGSITLTEKGSPGIYDTGTKWSSLFKVLNLRRAAFEWTLDALVQDGKARILSRPRLACQSGKEAELLVGGEKPIMTTNVAAAGGETTKVAYKEYGIKLKIRPTVAEEERIKLALNVEVSDIGSAETLGATGAPTAKAYPLLKRSASTELFLDNGQTLAIGGLSRQKSEEEIRKLPWLSDVPIFGLIFRKKVFKTGGGMGEKGDVELFITLTPKIISTKKEKGIVKTEPPLILSGPAVTEEPEPLVKYSRLVQECILENLFYPDIAKESGFQGMVKLALRISNQGELLDVMIQESSGYQILDYNTIEVAKNISSYPPFPSSLNLEELWVEIPVVYQLD